MFGEQSWPARMWLVRHGESTANLAREQAEADGSPTISLTSRDADAPLSELGREQARDVGRWFRKMPYEQRPNVVLTSPFTRAQETAAGIVLAMGQDLHIHADERLREKGFGILDELTKAGIEQRFPLEASRRKQLGNFYYGPPGGESWADVTLRLRSLLSSITLECQRAREGAHCLPLCGHPVSSLPSRRHDRAADSRSRPRQQRC